MYFPYMFLNTYAHKVNRFFTLPEQTISGDSCEARDQRGQAFIEFMLLLLILVGLSISFLKVSNSGVAKIWVEMANTIIGPLGEQAQLN